MSSDSLPRKSPLSSLFDNIDKPDATTEEIGDVREDVKGRGSKGIVKFNPEPTAATAIVDDNHVKYSLYGGKPTTGGVNAHPVTISINNANESASTNASTAVDVPASGVEEEFQFYNIYELNETNLRQRLIARTIIFIGFFLIGSGLLNLWLQWDVLSAVYFTVITVTSVGYGDLVPQNHTERAFVTYYALFGLALYGSTIGVLVSYLSERQKRIDLEKSEKTVDAINRALDNSHTNQVIQTNASSVTEDQRSTIDKSDRGTDTIPDPKTDGAENSGPSRRKSARRRVSEIMTSLIFQDNQQKDQTDAAKRLETVTEEFIKAYDEDIKGILWGGVWDIAIVIFMIFFGAIVFGYIADLEPISAIYWATITITTIGYGDIVPKTSSGRIFVIFYTLVGVVILSTALLNFAVLPLTIRLKQNERKLINQFTGDLSKQKLRAIFGSNFFKRIPGLRRNDLNLTKSEFVLLVLHLMRKVEDKDILLAASIFDKLDSNSNGELNLQEMAEHVQHAPEEPEPVRETLADQIEGFVTALRSGTPSANNSRRSSVSHSRPDSFSQARSGSFSADINFGTTLNTLLGRLTSSSSPATTTAPTTAVDSAVEMRRPSFTITPIGIHGGSASIMSPSSAGSIKATDTVNPLQQQLQSYSAFTTRTVDNTGTGSTGSSPASTDS